MTGPVTYDIDFVLRTIITWINDVTITRAKIRYVYVDDNPNDRLGEPSKSYLLGKIISPDTSDTVYLTYLLDPNLTWGEPDLCKKLYKEIDDYILTTAKKSLLSHIKIEILRDERGIQQDHEHKSNCRSEDTVRYLYEDTVGLWTPIMDQKVEHDYNFSFIRDSGKLLQDKREVYLNTGKKDFSDYVAEVKSLNDSYNFLDIDNIKEAFDEYKDIYYYYFSKYPFEEGDPGVATLPFRLINWTDYSIKDKIVNGRV